MLYFKRLGLVVFFAHKNIYCYLIAKKLSTSVSLHFFILKKLCAYFFSLCLVEVKILSAKCFDARVEFMPLTIWEISIPWHLWFSFISSVPFPGSLLFPHGSFSFLQSSHSPHFPTTPWIFFFRFMFYCVCRKMFSPPVLSTIGSSFQSKILIKMK